MTITRRAALVVLLLSQAACSLGEVCCPELPVQQAFWATDHDAVPHAVPPGGRGGRTHEAKAARRRTVERLQLALAGGSRHTAILSLPAEIRSPLPVIVVLGGFETGERALDVLKKDLDVIYASTDYPYKAPEQRGFVEDLRELPAIKVAVHRADLAVDALIERLKVDARVDLTKMSFVGASFGAPFAITAAARNPEIDGLILIHAFGRVELAITRQLVNEWGCWSFPVALLLGNVAWMILNYPSPESEVLKLHAHQRVLYVYSDADEQLPPASIATLRSALEHARAKVVIKESRGGHLGPGKVEMLDELMNVSLEWLVAQDLL